jgi:hypothetical protein
MVQYFIDGGGFMWPILITPYFGIGIIYRESLFINFVDYKRKQIL